VGGQRVDAGTGEPDLAASAHQAEQRTQRRGLADPVAAEQRGDAGAGDVERDAVQDLLVADPGVQVADRERGGCRLARPAHAALRGPR